MPTFASPTRPSTVEGDHTQRTVWLRQLPLRVRTTVPLTCVVPSPPLDLFNVTLGSLLGKWGHSRFAGVPGTFTSAVPSPAHTRSNLRLDRRWQKGCLASRHFNLRRGHLSPRGWDDERQHTDTRTIGNKNGQGIPFRLTRKYLKMAEESLIRLPVGNARNVRYRPPAHTRALLSGLSGSQR